RASRGSVSSWRSRPAVPPRPWFRGTGRASAAVRNRRIMAILIASTTESQAALDHAASDNWDKPFVEPAAAESNAETPAPETPEQPNPDDQAENNAENNAEQAPADQRQ